MRYEIVEWAFIICLSIIGCATLAFFVVKNGYSMHAPGHGKPITFYTEIPAVLESAYAYPEPRFLQGLRYVSIWRCEYGRIASEKEEVFMFAHDRGLITVGRVKGDLQVISVRELDND